MTTFSNLVSRTKNGIHNRLYRARKQVRLSSLKSPFYQYLTTGRGFPMWTTLEVEIHSLCNRDCKWCPRFGERTGVRKDSNGKPIKKQMPTERFYRIIDQAADLGYKGNVRMHRLSEALLDNRYLTFAKYIADKGMRVTEDTNGDVLRSNDQLCQALDGLVHTFIIGLYDYTSKEEKLKEMDFWNNRFKKTNVCFSLPLENCIVRKGAACYDDGRIIKDDAALDSPCEMLVRKILIRYDGEVSMCCEDDKCEHGFGNAFEKSLEELWWSPKRMAMGRQLLKSGARRTIKFCSTCYDAQIFEFQAVSNIVE